MTSVKLSKSAPASLSATAVVVGIHAGDGDSPVLATGAERLVQAGRKADAKLRESLSAVNAGTSVGAVTWVPAPAGSKAAAVLAVGLGKVPTDDEGPDLETLRTASAAAVRSLAGKESAVLALPASSPEQVAAVTLGAELGAYAFTRHHGASSTAKPPVEQITVSCARAADRSVKSAFGRAQHIAAGVRLARDLVNTAPVDLSPAELAEQAVRTAKENGVKVQVLDEKALAKGGYGGLLGVGMGSVNPPRLVRLAYSHPRAKRTLALCGKGITFDSGGLSLKPPNSMVTMKSDMAGAAAVLGAVLAIAKIKPLVNVVAYLACAENMPSGTAQRPSDVLTMYGGTTVEVTNTDAEGRLVLADALGRAQEDDPDLLVDVATLTGAQVVALGNHYFGVMANSDEARQQVVDAATTSGESAWPMPLPDELREALSSDVADLVNSAKERAAGMLIGGKFLQSFVEVEQAWAHLDIAGPAFSDKVSGYLAKGGTGVTVRTMVQLAEDLAP
ncbi:MAG: leucyl aminopeptidase [Streptosporangiales bacterium]|nr:leucyl aminopeptidase [Streptosporangiales bacterium]